jgi:succinyl-CoA synthetase alpha subunit
MGLPGPVGVVSRSGTLTYETVSGLSNRGIGQRYVIGIGGDPIRGTGFIECLELFENDPLVDQIVLIGEIGGNDEQLAAEYIKTHIKKPVYAYIAGHHAPIGVQLGHAGAILGNENESAEAKSNTLTEAGAIISMSIPHLVASVK